MRKFIPIVIFILVFAAGSAFSAINTDAVTINYYLGSISLPLSIVIVLSMVTGIILGALIITVSTLKLRYENRRLTKKVKQAEQEIDNLRTLPLTDTTQS
jgi:putative membrane protein